MTDRDARNVEQPTGTPPDEGLAYDPEMTEADEANIPPESDADPEAAEEPGDEELTPPR
jgi:hypothetical protein